MTEERIVNETTGGEKGQKLERFDLIPARPMEAVARHYGIGAKKYADENWRRGYNWRLSLGALERHLYRFKDGEDIDEETGSPHMAAIVFHALALLEFAETHPELDDRWREPEPPRVDVTTWLGETVRTIRGEEAHELEHLEGTPIDKLGLARPADHMYHVTRTNTHQAPGGTHD